MYREIRKYIGLPRTSGTAVTVKDLSEESRLLTSSYSIQQRGGGAVNCLKDLYFVISCVRFCIFIFRFCIFDYLQSSMLTGGYSIQ